MIRRERPAKPYDGFPLTPHVNGQWCKKIRGRIHYFGRDWQEALNLYLEQRDDLQAGRTPRKNKDEVTLADALNQFLSAKKLAEQSGEISPRSYSDYERTCDRIADCLGPQRLLTDIHGSDLAKLRAALAKGKRGTVSPTTLRGDLTRARMLFLYVNEYLAEKPLTYRHALKSPSQRLMRKVANERGPRMFEAKEIQAMLVAANPQMRGMIYLGINCGFGNNDCGTLPIKKVDLKKGWHHYWRPKTHNPRRCPLWPETVKALREVIDDRTDGLVFLTQFGNAWSDAENKRDNPISFEFRKLLIELEMYKPHVTTFYSLRRTFETIGATAGEQIAVDHIMGHIPATTDMAAVYRQKTFDTPLKKVADHVRSWLLGKISID